eukprot:3458738-Prymnesium_polylepis.2
MDGVDRLRDLGHALQHRLALVRHELRAKGLDELVGVPPEARGAVRELALRCARVARVEAERRRVERRPRHVPHPDGAVA